MTDVGRRLLTVTRRHFFRDCGVGVGKIALASLLAERLASAQQPLERPAAPGRGGGRCALSLGERPGGRHPDRRIHLRGGRLLFRAACARSDGRRPLNSTSWRRFQSDASG